MRRRALALAIAVLANGCATAAGGPPGETVRIEMSDFAFTPATITLKPGERVTLTFKNSGTQEHEFMVGTGPMVGQGYMQDWLAMARLGPVEMDHAGHVGASVRVPAHGTTRLSILVPPIAGDFEFACFIQGHYESGMKGTLVVDAGVAPNAVPNGGSSATPRAVPTAPAAGTPSAHPMDDMGDEGH